jgi:NAD(P)H-dependent FMN reductase
LAALTESRRVAGDAARVLSFALARLAALLALAAAAARRETTLLFAFADRAALPLAADREGREAEEPTTDLRLRDAVDRADALVFFETVLVAFLRAAMA